MNNFVIVNADTDSISFAKADGAPFGEEEQEQLLKSLNSLYPAQIKWEHDGLYDCVVVLKAKNYIKLHDGEIETKGSSIRNPNREVALKEFISKIVECLVYGKQHEIINIYYGYVKEVFNVQDISRWVTKKTITSSVLNPERTNEQKVLDALGGRQVQMGDKYFFFFDKEDKLQLQENWNNNHNTSKLLGKLYNTMNIFKNVYDMTHIPKLHLKGYNSQCALAEILGLTKPEKTKRGKKNG